MMLVISAIFLQTGTEIEKGLNGQQGHFKNLHLLMSPCIVTANFLLLYSILNPLLSRGVS